MTDPVRKRTSGLGRGLSALLGDVQREQPTDRAEDTPSVQIVPVASITPHPSQPRRHFDDEKLDELAASIRERGVIQPILVRPLGDGWQIVAGERRWRAAQRAHLHDVPVIIRELDEAQTIELALIENIQRQDLNAVEEAEAYQRLIADYGHTQDAVGKLVSKSRSHVANLLRLLELPEFVRGAVAEGALSMGHARALVTVESPEAMARIVIDKGLSVRDTERLARGNKPRRAVTKQRQLSTPDADIEALQRQLADLLGLKVTIAHGPDGGAVTLAYSSLDQLDMICQRLSGEPF